MPFHILLEILRYLFRGFEKNVYARSFLVRTARYWNHLPYNLRIFSHYNNVFGLKIMHNFGHFDINIYYYLFIRLGSQAEICDYVIE